MLGKFLRAYNRVSDSIMLKGGYALESEVVRTFGGVPQLGYVGLVRVDSTSILNGHKYVWLGPYGVPYKKIQAAKQKGETRVVLTGEDFSNGASLFNFGEMQRHQEEARTRGKDCSVKDLELILDCATILPDLVITEDSP